MTIVIEIAHMLSRELLPELRLVLHVGQCTDDIVLAAEELVHLPFGLSDLPVRRFCFVVLAVMKSKIGGLDRNDARSTKAAY